MTRPASFAWVLVAAGVLFFLRFGYEYGAGDHDELLSLLLYQLDSELFSRDWFVLDQGSQFTVRTPFLWLMQGVTWFLPLWAATLLVFLLGWLGVAWGLYQLAEALGASPVAATASTLLVLVGIPTWTLGGNSLAPNLLAPEMLGWALALPAVRFAIQMRWVWAGVLLVLTSYLHLIVGALVTGALMLMFLLGALGSSPRERWRQALQLGATVLLGALPMIIAIAKYRASGDLLPPEGPSPFFLFAELRLPHHYLPSEYPLGRWVRFSLLILAGLAGLAYMRHRQQRMHVTERLLLAIGLICAAAFPLIVMGRLLFIAQFQPFKLTVLANALLGIAICTSLASALPRRLRAWGGFRPSTSTGLAIGLVALLGLGLSTGLLDERVGPWARESDSFAAVETWIGQNTPLDALVAAPPNRSTFRIGTRRSVVVTFKAAPFNDIAMQEWYQRLRNLVPAADTLRARGLEFGQQLDRAYMFNGRADWDRLASSYGMTHVIQDRRGGQPPSGRAVFESGPWVVYELAPRSASGNGRSASPD